MDSAPRMSVCTRAVSCRIRDIAILPNDIRVAAWTRSEALARCVFHLFTAVSSWIRAIC